MITALRRLEIMTLMGRFQMLNFLKRTFIQLDPKEFVFTQLLPKTKTECKK